MRKIAVIGAGISGLTIAHELSHDHKITLFEREREAGGLIRCKRVDGSLFHICGGHVFNSKRKDVLDWFWKLFRQDEEFVKTNRNSVVMMEDHLEIPYPVEDHIYKFDDTTQKSIIADLLEIVKSSRKEPQNFEEFLCQQFGKTLYKLYFKPYNEKVWRRNLRNVPLEWLEGKLPMPSIEEIFFNNINHIKEITFVHASFWYEKDGGSQFIINRLAKGLDIRYNHVVEELKYDSAGKRWKIDNEFFDTVVFCGNIKDLIKTIRGIDLNEFSSSINNLEYHGTTSVFVEIDRNPYSWIYLPSNKYQSHRIICTGNFAITNNRTTISSDRTTATIEFTDRIDKEAIINNLKKIPLHPQYITHTYNEFTYPIQDHETRSMIKSLKNKLKPVSFYITGRFADWEYYNMDVAMGAALDIAKEIQ